jgi:hypothetical protein
MDWLNDPDRYCQTPADYQLCDRLRAAINASDDNARQTANNRLFAMIEKTLWFIKMRSMAKNNRFFAEALDNLWLWLFGTRQDGRSRLSAFEPRAAGSGFFENFMAYLKNKFGWLLKTTYQHKNKQFTLSLDALLEIDPHKYETPALGDFTGRRKSYRKPSLFGILPHPAAELECDLWPKTDPG